MYELSFRLPTPAPSARGRTSYSRRFLIAGACTAVLCIVTTFGCSAMRIPVVMDAIRAGRIAGVPPSAAGVFVYPGRADWRRYEQIALLQNAHIEAEAQVGRSTDSAPWEGRYSFVLGKRTSDGEWEIISVAQRADDETWREVALSPTTGKGGG